MPLDYNQAPPFSADPNSQAMQDWAALQRLKEQEEAAAAAAAAGAPVSRESDYGVSREPPAPPPVPDAPASFQPPATPETGVEAPVSRAAPDGLEDEEAGVSRMGTPPPPPEEAPVSREPEAPVSRAPTVPNAIVEMKARRALGLRPTPAPRPAPAPKLEAPVPSPVTSNRGDVSLPAVRTSPSVVTPPAGEGAVDLNQVKQRDLIDEELMRAYQEDKARKEHYDKYGMAMIQGMGTTGSIQERSPQPEVDAYKDWVKPRTMELLASREKTRVQMYDAAEKGLKLDPNSPQAGALRAVAYGSDAVNSYSEAIAKQTGQKPEIVKADFYNKYLSKMNPGQLAVFNEQMKVMGEYTTQKMNQALINSQRLSAEAQTNMTNRDISRKNELDALKRNPNHPAAKGFRAFILRIDPDMASQYPDFDNMSVDALEAANEGMKLMFEAYKHVNLNSAKVNSERYIAPGVRLKVQRGDVGSGVYSKVGGVSGTPEDASRVSTDLNVHPIMWTSGDTLLRIMGTTSGGAAAAAIKANTPDGQLIRREFQKFAEAYSQEHPNGGKYSKAIADALASGNIADVIWGAQGKGGLILQALTEAQQSTAKHRQRAEFDADAMSPNAPGGWNTPPFGVPFTTFKNGYLFDMGDRKIYYEHAGEGKWNAQEIPNQPSAAPQGGTEDEESQQSVPQ